MSQTNTNDENCNAILHASLLRGTLSIVATEMDIRRSSSSSSSSVEQEEISSVSGIVSALSTLSSPIETDYILQISSTSKVKFDDISSKRLSTNSQNAQELENYYISKRYIDFRNLAFTLYDHAEDIVKYYEKVKKDSKKGSHVRVKSGSLFASFEKVLSKPVEVAQYLTNNESNQSNLVSHLDSIFTTKTSSKNSKDESEDNTSKRELMKRRTSEYLDAGSPQFVREILLGIDKFFESIQSEKRQSFKKTNYAHVKSVAERRLTIINGALRSLIHAFQEADLASIMSKNNPSSNIPGPLITLISSFEKFLLTDVVIMDEDNTGGENSGGGELSGDGVIISKDMVANDDDVDVGETQISRLSTGSFVQPVSTRPRASQLDREKEEEKCKEVAELILLDEKEEDTRGVDSAHDNDGAGVAQLPPGLLPEDPIDFGIIVALGAILFKILEGRSLTVQIDMLLMFGLGCGLLGYRLACRLVRPVSVHVEKKTTNRVTHNDKHVRIVSPQLSPQKASHDRRASLEDVRPSRRDMLHKSSGTLNVTSSMKERRISLIQASIKSVRHFAGLDDEIEKEEEHHVEPAKTFDRFPDGAAIGSHLNCFSSPPSSNFHVRGPNYLKDKKKVPSGNYLFPTRGCDLFLTDNAPVNMGRNPAILEGKLRDVPTFIINYRLPWGVFLSYHEIPKRFLPFLRRGQGHGDLTSPLPSMVDMSSGERAACNFLLSDAEEKNQVWKIVPVVVEGPWVVKRVVGGKPAIVGTKLPITYTYQPAENGKAEYLEADLDIVSSAAARNILAVVRSYTQVLTIDLGYVIQGNKQEELPEQMMLGLRLHGLDPLTAELLPEFDGDGTSLSGSWEEDTGNETE